jgi:L-amino acid N-acyltransferase YncA
VSYEFEAMSEKHRQPVIDIFNYYIQNSQAAFPDAPVGYDFYDRFLRMTQGHPAIVVCDEAQIVGFAMLHPYHWATTFKRTAEITYFLMPDHTQRGLGTHILNEFIHQAQSMSMDTLLACISSLNLASIQFHQKHGFRECGRLARVGRKFEQDFDIVWMQKHLK